jgi:hypothetical protein
MITHAYSTLKKNQSITCSLNVEFCYGVYNQCESFICLNLIVKNIELPIEKYFTWWTSTKLVWDRYQNY